MRPWGVVIFLGAAITGGVALGQSAPTSTSAGPNIILLIADDLRADSFSCTGHPFVKTPAIDQLAAEGVIFENMFAITPLCAPSRATLLTGRQPYAVGVTHNGQELAPDTWTIARALRDAGYTTAYFGKYHLSRDESPPPGWDHWVAFQARAGGEGEGGEGDAYIDPTFNVNGRSVTQKGYSTDILADMAKRWIQSRQGGPFFLVLSLKSAHTPFVPPRRDERLFLRDEVPLPESYHDPILELPRWLRGDETAPPLVRAEQLASYLDSLHAPNGPALVTSAVRRYARVIPSIDDAVSKLRDEVAADGRLDQTAFLITSDNGFLFGEHGVFGKGMAYDPALRVPLIIRAPGAVEAGARRRQQVLTLDIAPTVLDLAGIAPPPTLEGRSLTPLLSRDDAPWRTDWLILSQSDRRSSPPRPQYLGVRTDRWKYVRYLEGGLEETLFDLQSDSAERRNLAGETRAAGTLQQLRERMRQLMQQGEFSPAFLEAY